MNKAELVAAVAETTSATKKDIEVILNAATEAIIQAVVDGEEVRLVGFGTFKAKKRQAREGRNPGTGESIQIPATIVPGFEPGKDFKQRVKG